MIDSIGKSFSRRLAAPELAETRMPVETYLEIGEQAEYSRKISEADVLRFAEISGDFSPIHVDEAFARTTPFGRRIAHGALLMGLLSTASTIIADRSVRR